MKNLILGFLLTSVSFSVLASEADYSCTVIDIAKKADVLTAEVLASSLSGSSFTRFDFGAKKYALGLSNDFGSKLTIAIHDFTGPKDKWDIVSSVTDLGAGELNPKVVFLNSNLIGLRVKCSRMGIE